MKRRLWRVSNHCDLSGLGGERADGRWHTSGRGKRIVYLSEHPALALLESLANLKGNPGLLPDKYQLLEVGVEDEMMALTDISVGEGARVPTLTRSLASTRNEGDAWLKQASSALKVVPSFPAPFSLNYLLNPLHPDASRVRIEACHSLEYDERLFRIRS